MSISATVLLLTTVSGATPADITPVSLGLKSQDVDLGAVQYDWGLQQGPSATGVDLMRTAQTAHCNTTMSTTDGGKDKVPDCGFD